ncbi:MAG TPA: glycoside hydrolase family 3 C-terminal domain-containing protein [Acidimicrobiales bacterium]|nr:glycoside hydrolase family 3 C-terminal domain-containing protein [Acidimicrobiales bacterium]
MSEPEAKTEGERGMQRIEELLGELTIEEKVSLLAGEDMWHVPAIERLGIGVLKMSDGPIGARGAQHVGGPPSACFPSGIALGATWDVDLAEQMGAALGLEAQAKGAHVLLGPTVNIQRYPLGGRHFECMSEDPFLTARLATTYVHGVQSTGVGACIKHLAANDTEVDRFTIDCQVDERTLREVYLLPFEATLHAGDGAAWSTMGAYSKLNGPYCCEHPWLLTELLRDEWGWDGAVVSDWTATHSTGPGLNAGLDVEMPGPTAHRGAKLLEAVATGEVKPDAIDTAVRRVLLLGERTGALTGSPVDERYDDDPARAALTRRLAASAIVVLQNEDEVLPLDPTQLQCVAVIGPNADVVFQPMGGGSAEVTPAYVVTPLEGLRAALGPDVEVIHEVGCLPATEFINLDPRELTGDGFVAQLTGGSVADQTTTRSTFRWSTDVSAARVTAGYRPSMSGQYAFELRGRGRMRLSIDGAAVVDGWERGERPPVGSVTLTAGAEYALLLEYESPPEPVWFTGVRLAVRPPWPADPREAAIVAAAGADAAVVVVGLTREVDTEGQDRPNMSLPDGQNELVAAIAAANPRTIVVLNAGSPVEMPWLPAVAGVVQLWYPGQEGGNALADVLTGAADGGRLPCTFPVRVEDSPGHAGYPGADGKLPYEEGVFVGYRGFEAARTEPQFPFGHGLSYTTFEYGDLTADANGASLTVTNTGARSGSEVVQLYVGDVEASLPRPAKELKGFRRIALGPGETSTVRFDFDDRTFAFWNNRWLVEAGEFEIMVGASSADIRARATIAVSAS